MTVGNLLLVDRDQALRQALAEQLAGEDGYAIDVADGPDAALDRLSEGVADLVLLDGAGEAPWQVLRDAGVRLPIILLAPPGAAVPPIDAGGGVNEIITRPFRLAALLAAIEAQLQHRPRDEDLGFGPYRFRPADKLLLAEAGRRIIRLTEKETAILKYLLDAGDGPTAREALLDQVWGYNPEATTHTLETHIYRLRQKIEIDPSRAEILVSEPGGYRLVT